MVHYESMAIDVFWEHLKIYSLNEKDDLDVDVVILVDSRLTKKVASVTL